MMLSLFILTIVLVSNLNGKPEFIKSYNNKSDCQGAALLINAQPEMKKHAKEHGAVAICLSPAGFGGVDQKTT